MKNNEEITCSIEFTEGAIERITDAFIDIYFGIKSGIYKGPLTEDNDNKNN